MISREKKEVALKCISLVKALEALESEDTEINESNLNNLDFMSEKLFEASINEVSEVIAKIQNKIQDIYKDIEKVNRPA